jgi:hypothetical protein
MVHNRRWSSVQSRTHLNRAKNPEQKSLYEDQARIAHTDYQINPNVLADVKVGSPLAILFRPVLEPNTTPYCRIMSAGSDTGS